MNYWLGLWSASSAVWAGGRCGRVVGDERGWVFGKTIFLKKASFHFHLLTLESTATESYRVDLRCQGFICEIINL